MEYKRITPEIIPLLKPFFSLRPNKTYNGTPLDQFLYRYYYDAWYCILEGRAVLTLFIGDDGQKYGYIPYSTTEDVPYFFKLQKEYFNRVLGIPLVMQVCDGGGIGILKESGLLEGFEVREIPDSRDYLYDAEALRTLAGRKYSKKRNHVNKFMKLYHGRWSYRKLTPADSKEALSFLNEWMAYKKAGGEGCGINEKGEGFNPEVELDAEYRGIRDILKADILYSYARMGGIFIDGKLEAFSIGDYNPLEKMAVISVEKANETIPGLYQVINQQFLLNEYPEAVLINREDDVGIWGLRQSKLSYYPVDFARKYTVTQKA